MVKTGTFLDERHSGLFLFVALQATFLFLTFGLKNPLLAFVLIGLLLAAPIVLFEPRWLLYVLVFYIAVLPSAGWGERYEVFHVFVDLRLVFLLLVAVFLSLWLRNLQEGKYQLPSSALNLFVAGFVVLAFLSLFYGLSRGNSPLVGNYDLYFIVLFTSFYLAKLLFPELPAVRRFALFLIAISTIASLEYIYLTLSQVSITDFLVKRVTTQQPHLAQVAMPLAMAFLFTERNWWRKGGYLLILALNLAMVVFSQQRALWVTIFLSFFMMTYFYNVRFGATLKNILNFLKISSIILIGIVLFVVILQEILHINIFVTVYARLMTLQSVTEDISYFERFTEIDLALKDWQHSPWFGMGLGATHIRAFQHRDVFGLDNSYAFVLWKMGLIGLCFFLAIYGTGLWRMYQNFRLSKAVQEKLLWAAFVTALVGLLIIAYTNLSIVRYRFNIIWLIMIGLADRFYHRYNSEKGHA
ncbi:MAG: hypothetical protein D6715_02465 [Calditrichaeota bacterium]|nr:MAG: hypothetical protein D6715_02465 [Calditrichota bacterium]